jgi:hypothetical protein
MHNIKKVDISRNLNGASLFIPEEELLEDEAAGGVDNHDYCDMRGRSWEDTAAVLAYEKERIEQILPLSQEETDELADECYEEDSEYFEGIDIGVASVVFALSAAGGVPVASCNGGAFGGHHLESYPLVVFYADVKHTSLLEKVAEEVQVGLKRGAGGAAIVFADDILKMYNFALALYTARSQIDALNS